MISNSTISDAYAAEADRSPLDPSSPIHVRALPWIAPPSVAAFEREYVTTRRPVVLRGLAADWPAVRRWSLDYLQREFGAVRVTTIRAIAGRVVMDAEQGAIEESLPLSACIDGLRAGALDRYITSRTAGLPESLRNDAPMLPYCAGADWCNSNIWMGAGGTLARMHRDLADNLHVLVFGRKRFTLVSPDQSAFIYPNRLFDKFPNGCRTDIENPDFVRFPKLQDAEPWVAELEAGDAIYIPRRWWHHVRTLAVSTAVNYWWANGQHRLLILAADYVKRVRGISR